jgi:hypothetical protein
MNGRVYGPTELRTNMWLQILIFSILLGGVVRTQQQAEVNFDARVARPAYSTTHPKVLFDEAHFNFHTAGGRYKPFADLLTNDGYQITSTSYSRRHLRGMTSW